MVPLTKHDRTRAGVRERFDGNGDPWANEHRLELGHRCYLDDLDGIAYAKTDDRLYLEYAIDDWRNRGRVDRAFAVVAIFDRKVNRKAATCQECTLSTAFYLWLCRMLAAQQRYPPRFFYVLGAQAPWTLEELDISDGFYAGSYTLGRGAWRQVWREAGLEQLRCALEASLR